MKFQKKISEILSMNIFSRGLWFLVMTVLFLVILVSGSLFCHSQAGIRELKEKYGSGIILSVDSDIDHLDDTTWYQLEDNSYVYIGPEMDEAFLEKIRTVPGIAYVNTELITDAYLRDIKLQPGSWSRIAEEWTTPELQEVIQELQLMPEINARLADIYGYQDSEKIPYFIDGSFELIQGRHIKEEDAKKVLISDRVAEENHLTLGDSIYLEVNEYMRSEGEDKDPENVYASQNLEIIGIYHINSTQNISSWTNENMIADNYFFADETSMRELIEKDYQARQISADIIYSKIICYVEKSEDVYQVINTIKNLNGIEWKYYTVEPADDSFQISALPLNQIKKISGICFFTSVILFAVAMFVFLNRYKHDRRKQVCILFFMSFILATGCAIRISPEVGSWWYSKEITEEKVQIERENKERESKIAEVSDIYSREKYEERSAGEIETPLHEISDSGFDMTWWVVILTFGGICLVIFIEIVLQKSEEIHKENQSLVMLDEMSKQYYQELSRVLDKNRQMVHDSRNHLLILWAYEKEGEYEKFRQYIQKLKEDAQ